ncbi:MAG: D-threonate 4-phosphate dehydrogenase [Paracidovorax wautersii]|uniref:D-threonate 4-phosphate dehydrogenase n=1 Tax=Paracidovorax wautersii TaxID=1177982 RepID=A0A7V8JQW0_9BURK|nr:MAG: D-threonate 4-phosphate dehydrogenase [Paracidovorax wautersii]
MTAFPSLAPLAITQGDPAGIGPEIIAKAFRDAPADTAGCFVVGDVAVLRRAAALVGGHLPVAVLAQPADVAQVPPRTLPVLSLQPGAPADLAADLPAYGQVSARAGRMAAEAVTWAARAALRGEIVGLVTAPLHKAALAAAGVPFPGHTELLQAEAARALGLPIEQVPVRMMLANDELRTVLVSIHVSLRRAIEAVTHDQVLETLRITHAALNRWPALAADGGPRLAVAGLNPHAGEDGLFGDEEIHIIAPAIAAAQKEGIQASGPYPPDTVFMRARRPAGSGRGAFDAVIAMYHDQGLIPVKYLGVEHGVNVTLGLPLVRTSPDHGTAFDIAGQGVASAASLIQAIRMARQLATA